VKKIILLLLFQLPIILCGQQAKQEYEKVIKAEEFPKEALKSLEEFGEEPSRLVYYREVNEDGEFYEAKGRWGGRYQSVKFTDGGELLDVEILISIDDIPEESREEIMEYFEDKFKKYRLTRIQRQYSSEELNVIKCLNAGTPEVLKLRYEIEAFVLGKKGRFGPYEFLFSDQGELIQSREIKQRASDNVKY